METPGNTKSLLSLAQEKFTALSEAEKKILLSIPQGEVADCTLGGEDDPATLFDEDKADSWGESRSIRAALLRWLAVAPEVRCYIDPLGIMIHGAVITGSLKLSHADVSFPLVFHACHFVRVPAFSHGHFRMLDFSHCACPGFRVDSAQIDTDLILNKIRCKGLAVLRDARIGGILQAGGANLVNPEGHALSADRIKIGGSCFLRNGFSAEGEVRLLGAEIGGNLDCCQASFANKEDSALNVNMAKILGNCLLRDKFSAEGEVRLLGAEIGGNLECHSGNFSNLKGNALNAEHLKIGDAAGLEEMAGTKGRFNFFRAEIGSLIFRTPPKQSEKFVFSLRQAHCAVLFDNPSAWKACHRYVLSGFRYDSLDNGSTPIADRLEWLRRADNGSYSPNPTSNWPRHCVPQATLTKHVTY